MAHQTIQVTEIATIPGTNKIARVKSLNGHVYTVEEIREFIDEGIPINEDYIVRPGFDWMAQQSHDIPKINQRIKD